MKIGIVGSSGYIATYLIETLRTKQYVEEIIGFDKVDAEDTIYCDLENIDGYDLEILEKLDMIIFTAAISGPDLCADKFEYCWKINVTGTATFIRTALDKGCKVLFFSSDAVYGADQGKVFDEESVQNGETPYGRMKKEVEAIFSKEKNFKAIRLSYVVSKNDRFVSYCMGCLKNGNSVEVYHPFYRNCITVHDVIKAVCWLAENWDEYEHFSLNLAGRELVSRVRIVDELNRIFKGKLAYRIVDPGAGFYRNRPPITQMRSLYAEKYNIWEQKSFTEKLVEEMEEN